MRHPVYRIAHKYFQHSMARSPLEGGAVFYIHLFIDILNIFTIQLHTLLHYSYKIDTYISSCTLLHYAYTKCQPNQLEGLFTFESFLKKNQII